LQYSTLSSILQWFDNIGTIKHGKGETLVNANKETPVPTPAGGEAEGAYARRILIFSALCAFLVGLDSLVVSPLIPNIAAATHTAENVGGLLVTAYALLYALAAPLFGPISDRLGRKKMIIAGMLLFTVATALTGVGESFSWLLVFRALAGLGGAMIMPSIFALAGDTFSYQQRGQAIGIIMAALIGSTVLGVPLGTLLAYVSTWRWTFWIIGLLALVVLLLTGLFLPATTPKRALPVGPLKAYLGQFRAAFADPSVLFALFSTLFWTIGLQGMFAYIGVYYHENFGLNVGQIGLVILAAGLGSVVGLVFGGKLSDRIGKKVIVVCSAVIAAIGVLSVSLLTHVLIAAIIMHVIWSTSIGFGQSSLTALISELSPRARGTVMSLNSSAQYLGTTAASVLASALLAWSGFLTIGILCAIACLLVVPVISLFVKEAVQPAPVSNPTGDASSVVKRS
jgi:multidrug resistance protein